MPLGGGPISIGRSSESNVVIRDDYTSTNHARLDLQGSAWVLTDLGSTNGTFVAGQKVTSPPPWRNAPRSPSGRRRSSCGGSPG